MASATSQFLTAEERLALIQVKVERANKHVRDLDSEISAFIATKPYEVLPKIDPKTGKERYLVTKCQPIPDTFSVITGDAIQNLRSALDHLVQQLWLVNNPGVASTGDVSFPTDRCATQFKANAPRKVKGLRQDAIDAIYRIEPYDRGNGGDLSVLNRLNRIDKHRLLVTISSAFFEDLNLKSFIRDFFTRSEITAAWAAYHPWPDFIIRSADPTIYGLKVGDEVTVHPVTKPKAGEKVYFRFEIAIHEPGVIEGKPLVITLQHFADLVRNTVILFKPCLS